MQGRDAGIGKRVQRPSGGRLGGVLSRLKEEEE